MKLSSTPTSELSLADLFPDFAGVELDSILPVSGITADSRQVKPGSIFAALAGSHADGATFAKSACENGAVVILAAEDAVVPDVDVPVIRVADPRRDLALIASKLFSAQPGKIVAVTGTAGKTSVASFVRQIWSAEKRPAAMIGTTGVTTESGTDYGSLTTPDPELLHQLLNQLADDGISHCSMEASSHGLDQRRLDGVRLSAAGFTNLGRDHMDYHQDDVEDYLSAKLRLFDTLMQPGQPAVVFADDEYSERVLTASRERGLDVKAVGRKGDFIALKRVEQERYRQIAELVHASQTHRVILPMAGEFQLYNALVAAGLAIATGSDAGTVFAALESLQGASGRLEHVGSSAAGAPCYVDYAHKPDALENVLLALRPFTTGELVVVFGCGGDRDAGKRPMMGEIAQRLADRVIVTDDNPRTEDPASIRAAILEAAPGATEIADRRAAIVEAVRSLGEGDTLVVAGKGHETGQIVGDVVHEFSDHDVLRESLLGDPA
ncbi:MAG: UDP-N-acetylmuramoyl-L-alanyl-D-glutamate--2,6-diaminopimelate ligase [Pseudomonadota bacterium]